MSGWGDWLEKGKALAATIDQQINESVGVEAPSNEPSSNAAADLNDAWNQDFDDDVLADDQAESGRNNQEEEEIIMENLQETPIPSKEELFSSPFPERSVIHTSATVPDSLQTPAVSMEATSSFPEKESTASITDNHFAGPPDVDISEDNIGQNEGWDEDDVLHIDSHEAADEGFADQPTDEKASADKLQSVLCKAESQRFQPTVVEPRSFAQPEEPIVSDPPPVSEASLLPAATRETDPNEKKMVSSQETHAAPSEQEPLHVTHAVEEDPVEAQSLAIALQDESLVPESLPQAENPADRSILSQNQADVDEKVWKLQEESQMAVALMQSQLEDLQMQLGQRENQLASKAEQLTTMQAMFESEKEELKRKVADTKEEAKKRILRAKERVEAMEKRLATAHKSGDEAGAQSEIIAALREEGEKLAHKQSEMEKVVRSAKAETRDLREQLEAETEAKEKALAKITSMEADLKRTKDDLSAARKGESQVAKLDAKLLGLKEECEKKASTNLSLEQQVKELKAENKEIRTDVERARRGAELENEAESRKLKKEHNDLLCDLENKLRTSEREASIREDALRHEVAEIRKRWQDAVRRADALSMDVQQSTAPLLRQLESLERQSRARAANWAELEAKLRSDLDDSVIENEKLLKERNDFKSTANRLQRLMKDRDDELSSSRSKLDDQTVRIRQLETRLITAETERQKTKEKYEEIEKIANEGVSKVRSDMMQTVVESEERYRAQIESTEKELRTERDIRSQLERQVEQLLDNSGIVQLPSSRNEPKIKEEKQMKLRSTEGQAEILASTLTGLDSDDDEASDVVDEEENSNNVGLSSFAAMEELNQRLKGTTVELSALRQQLTEAEASRESLMEELIQTRQAKEKLPLFEAKVKELTEMNREKELEIMGLRQDIQEVGQLYRSQLNSLIEEKASAMSSDVNGGHKDPETTDELPADGQPLEDSEEQEPA